jgi:hypothetical protein
MCIFQKLSGAMNGKLKLELIAEKFSLQKCHIGLLVFFNTIL